MIWRFTFNDELSASVFPLDFEGIRSVFASTCWHWYRLFSKPFFCFLLVGADWQVYIRQVRSALIDARNWPAGSQATPWTKCKCSFNICRTLPAQNYDPSCQVIYSSIWRPPLREYPHLKELHIYWSNYMFSVNGYPRPMNKSIRDHFSALDQIEELYNPIW